MGEVILDATNVCKSYHNGQNNLDVLKDFSLKVSAKEIITISGQSGCGKSTMLNIMSGIVKPSEGRLLFDGVDVTDETTSDRNIAQVFQFPVFDHLSLIQAQYHLG